MKVSFIGLGIAFILFYLAGNSFAQGSESFSNIPTSSSSSYLTRTWTGDNGGTWTANYARTDQTINGKAICLQDFISSSYTRNILSPSYQNGVGTLSFKYVRALSNTFTRSIAIYINSTFVEGVSVSENSDVVMTYSKTINISGNIQIEIRSTGNGQVKIDDISWDTYYPGWKISNLNTLYKIDFDNTVDEINNSQFTGNGFTSNPVSGQINSRGWAVTGFSDGNLNFEGSKTTSNTDFTRGISSGGVSTGGIYAFTVSENNRALGFQANDDDFTPGTVILKIRNYTNSNITSLLLCYTIYVRNDRSNSSSFNFSHSADNSSYTQVSDINLSSPGTQDVSPAWKAYIRTIKLEGLNIGHNNNYYLRWSSDFISGTGEADEFALDDIQIVANPSDIMPAVNGTVKELVVNGNIKLSGSTTVSDTLKLSSGKIYAGNYNLTVSAVTGAGSGSYVNTSGTGYLIMKSSGIAGKTYPVGTESSYNPVYIKHPGTAANFLVRTGTGLPYLVSNSDKAVQKFWEVTPEISVSKCVLEFQFNDSNFGASFTPGSTVVLGRYSDGKWNPNSASITNSLPLAEPYVLKAENINAFSYFAIGNEGAFTLYSQNFDGEFTDIPGAEWTNTGLNNLSWRREDKGTVVTAYGKWDYPLAGAVKPFGKTGHSISFHSYIAPNGQSSNLDLSVDLSAEGNKLLSFDFTNASGTDNLVVLYSPDGSEPGFVSKATLTTCPWTNFVVDLGAEGSANSKVRFRATSDFGHTDIGIDNINIWKGSIASVDGGVVSVDVSHRVNGAVIPKATVKNYGAENASFDVKLFIDGSTEPYTVEQAILGPGESTQVVFSDETHPNWQPNQGSHTLKACVVLTGDGNESNNCLEKSIEANSSGYWSDVSSAFTTLLGSGCANSQYFFSVGGYTSTYGKGCFKYDIANGTITSIAELPEPRVVLATALSGNYVYAFGGRNVSVYKNTVYRYDISADEWSTVTSTPQNIGWCKAAVYGNYIYLAGGYNGTNILKTVYLYDIANNTWASATDMPEPRFGGAFSIAGNKLVYVAGASGNYTLSNSVFVGTINPEHPEIISWNIMPGTFPGNGKPVVINSNKDLSEPEIFRNQKNIKGTESIFPAGSLYGLDAVPWGSGTVAVGGGTAGSNFMPEDPSPFYVYNPETDEWSAMPEMPVPASGSSMASANTSGSNLEFMVFSGNGIDNSFLPLLQIWKTEDAASGQVKILEITSLLEGSYPASMKNNLSTEAIVEIREAYSPYEIVQTVPVMQNAQGLGSAELINIDTEKPYYLVVRYLNGLETWSSYPQNFMNGVLKYDFTVDSSKAFGNSMVKINGKWCVISGDINQDGKINAIDRGICWNFRGTEDELSDLNRDGIVNESDRAVLSKNKNISAKRPEGSAAFKLNKFKSFSR